MQKAVCTWLPFVDILQRVYNLWYSDIVLINEKGVFI